MKRPLSMGDKLRQRLAKLKPKEWILKPEILLHGQIPKPLHSLNPRTLLGRAWWDRERLKAYKSTDYHCQACGVFKTDAKYHAWLEGHENYEIDYLLGRMTYLGILPLCHYCHSYIHRGRLEALLESGKIHHAKYVSIIQHGDSVLAKAGLVKQRDYNGPVAEWADWRLVIDGKEYEPIYKNFEQWKKAMVEK